VKNDGSRGLPYSAPFSAALVIHSFIHSFIHISDKDFDSLPAFYNYNNYDLTTTILTHTEYLEGTAATA
jgi:hypothetical protein